MKIVVIHNYYQLAGGEDEVFRTESELLETHGHEVIRYTVSNHSVPGMNRASLASAAVWNKSVYRELRELFRREKPAVAHFHNTFPLISPAAYYAAREERVAVIQTLHNFRLVCPNALLFRDGGVCEDCLGKAVPWPGVIHACYRNSPTASAVTAAMLAYHRAIGTWKNLVTTYIALSEFSRQKFIVGGLPPDKITVKPNFLSADPGPGKHAGRTGLFVGRLAPEKGLAVLHEAWPMLRRSTRLKLIGGPVPEGASACSAFEWLAHQPRERVYAEMKNATFLVFPSECYENCPMTIIEAFATGLPVIVSGHGSAAEMVADGRTGLHFSAGDPVDLAAKVDWALSNPAEMAAMGQRAREEFELKYSADVNYFLLMELYTRATAGGAIGGEPARGTPAAGAQRWSAASRTHRSD